MGVTFWDLIVVYNLCLYSWGIVRLFVCLYLLCVEIFLLFFSIQFSVMMNPSGADEVMKPLLTNLGGPVLSFWTLTFRMAYYWLEACQAGSTHITQKRAKTTNLALVIGVGVDCYLSTTHVLLFINTSLDEYKLLWSSLLLVRSKFQDQNLCFF